jgi:hypothetical protein
MDDDAQLERDLLLARRLKLTVRLVFYPLLLGGVLIAWHVRHAQAEASKGPKGPDVVLRNFAGDRAFAKTEDNQLTWLQVEAAERCDSGTTFTYRLRFPASAITQRINVATATRAAFEGADDNGSPVIYGPTVATVTAGITQLDVSVSGSLRWTRPDGNVTTCVAASALMTLSVIGA